MRTIENIRVILLSAGFLVAAGLCFGEPQEEARSELDPLHAKSGGHVYATVCAACHDQGLNRAPPRDILNFMTPEFIRRALTEGVMQAQGSGLTAEDKVNVAEYITGRVMGSSGADAPALMCRNETSLFDVGEPPIFSGWGLTPAGTHAIPGEVAGIDRSNVGKLTLKWSLAFPNAIRARSEPALAGGAIFVGSNDGTVFALDRESGCARWLFHASAEVRTGIVVAPWRAGDARAQPLLYFGDLVGNIYAVKARNGELVWKKRPDEHPYATMTATPVLHQDRLYVAVSSTEEGTHANAGYPCCTFRGSVVAFDSLTGKKIWQRYMTGKPVEHVVDASGAKMSGPSGAPLWNSPSVDERRMRLYFGTGDNFATPTTITSDAIVALDMRTGKFVWTYQALANDAWNVSCETADKTNCPPNHGPDYDFGAGAILVKASNGREYVLAGQKSGVLHAVDADTGKLVWKTQIGRGGVLGGIHFGIAAVGDTVFVPVNDVPDGRTYREPPRPGLYAIDVKTGDYRWKAPATNVCGTRPGCQPGYSAAITATPELVFAGSNDGHLRAFDAGSGLVLWDYDTVREFKTVNGAIAHGGSMGGGAAPIAYKEMLIMNSGYAFINAMKGNALLVFQIE